MSKKVEVGQVWYSRIDGRQRAVAAVYGNGWIKCQRVAQEFDCSPKDWAAWVTVYDATLVREADGGPPWVEHAGLQQPVNDDVVVEVRLRNGECGISTAGDFAWRDAGDPCDIIAYRIRPDGWQDAPGEPISNEHLAAIGIVPRIAEHETQEPEPQAEAAPSVDSMQVNGRHYLDMPIQPWAVMESVLTPEEFRGFLKGNIIGYTMRHGRKEGTDDAGKARHYMQKLAEVEAKRHV